MSAYEGPPAGFEFCKENPPQAEEAAEKLKLFVILSEAKNPSPV